ncbi:MAG: hypothetical protein NTX11_01635 [Candidatus Saccharibacteria bacterium]|nr:hypothetical protein [Candidatus Saccharibacteria bacterium]
MTDMPDTPVELQTIMPPAPQATGELVDQTELDVIISQEQFDEYRKEEGFNDGFHGTFWKFDEAGNKTEFLYVKPCHKVNTLDEATEAVALLRYATDAGVLFPDTQWGIREDTDGRYQLYASTPKLISYGENQSKPDPSREPVKTYGPPYADLFDEESQVLAMYRRLDPDFDPAVGPAPESILQLLNPFEAAHADNWGWDETGRAYPIDVEILDVSSSDKTSAIIHDWYITQQRFIE